MQTDRNLKSALAHVLWIGGATDAGKQPSPSCLPSDVVFSYIIMTNMTCHKHKSSLARPHYQAALTRSAEERWMGFTPHELMQRSLLHMADRFPLVIEGYRPCLGSR